jgi:ADP-L-glycero-D-manno-heptose 6-epimerase
MNLARSRVLVTGGAGFIGSALIWELNKRGCERIIVCDKLDTTLKWRHLRPLAFEDYVEAADLPAGLRTGTLGKFNLVLHMGAVSSTTERDAELLLRNNYEFTRNLAQWALTSRVRFVYASSAATYGDGAAGMRDDDDVKNLQRLRPLNMYGYSKQMFDLYAARAGWLERIVGVKYFNVFGPNEDHKGEMRSVVHKAFEQIRSSGRVRLFKSHRLEWADGEQQRDFLYIKDAVAMTLHLATTRVHGIYNVGSGAATTWNQLVAPVFAALGRERKIDYIEMPEEIREKYQYFTQADITKLRAAGYKHPVTGLADAVTDYVKNYLVPEKDLGD